jgi:PemK-like, MazF-like toxin of type II toxin-antitoxin system
VSSRCSATRQCVSAGGGVSSVGAPVGRSPSLPGVAGSGWVGLLGRLVDVAVRQGTRARPARRRTTPAARPPATRQPVPRGTVPSPHATEPRTAHRRPVTEHTGPLRPEYRPHDDGRPDPGEVVWAWVPFEEGDGRGKDRPVLVVGRDGEALLGLMLSSKDHDLDADDEARHGRHWVDVGTGPWDRQGRPSEVRVDRVLRIDPADVRREGAALDRDRFAEVAAEVHRHRG